MSAPADRRPVAARPLGRIVLLALFVLFAAAPTAGDIGSCGQPADDLDPVKFFESKQALDCRRCGECGISSAACDRACAPALEQSAFPTSCFPLVHDGEVCLDALGAASCKEYATYVSDASPTVPTECDFCPAGGP
jgi:hypothetical protein